MNRLIEKTLGAICFVAGVGLVAPACGPENNGESQCSDGQVFATVNGTDGCYDECDNGACSGGATCQSGLCVGGDDNNGTNNANAGTNNGSSNANAGTNNDTTNAGTNNTTANAGTNNDTTAACPEALDPPIGPCDPICQSGCDGGQNCAAGSMGAGADLMSRCIPAGDTASGEMCTPGMGQCQVGYGCVTNPDNNESRCREYCVPGVSTCTDTNEQCIFGLDQNGTLGVCGEPPEECDPFDDMCPDTQKCGPTQNAGFQCLPAGDKGAGEMCASGECSEGLYCTGPQGGDTTCLEVCNTDDPMCDAGQCQPLGIENYGVCFVQ